MVPGVRWALSWPRGHNVFMILQFQSTDNPNNKITSDSFKFIKKILKAGRLGWSDWKGAGHHHHQRSQSDLHIPQTGNISLSSPPSYGRYWYCISQEIYWDTQQFKLVISFNFIACYWNLKVRRWGEGWCQVGNRDNLSGIMLRYLTPSYGLGMTILQISWVGFILTF